MKVWQFFSKFFFVEFILEKRKFPIFSFFFFFGVWSVGENSPPKKSLVREPWFNVAPKTVLGGEPWGSRDCPKQVWAIFDFYKKKSTGQRAVVQCGAQNSFGGEPRFKGLPKTVLGGF